MVRESSSADVRGRRPLPSQIRFDAPDAPTRGRTMRSSRRMARRTALGSSPASRSTTVGTSPGSGTTSACFSCPFSDDARECTSCAGEAIAPSGVPVSVVESALSREADPRRARGGARGAGRVQRENAEPTAGTAGIGAPGMSHQSNQRPKRSQSAVLAAPSPFAAETN